MFHRSTYVRVKRKWHTLRGRKGRHVTLRGKIMAMNPGRYVNRDNQKGWCWRFTVPPTMFLGDTSLQQCLIWGNTVPTISWFFSLRNPMISENWRTVHMHLHGIHFSKYHNSNPYQTQKLNQLWCGAKHLIFDIIGIEEHQWVLHCSQLWAPLGTPRAL